MKQLRDRMATVKSTQKITEAMKLVAAAKVRSAQQAVLNGRPFTEELIKALYEINLRVGLEELEVKLCDIRPVKSVLLVVFSSDRGLCGGYNNKIIKYVQQRYTELTQMGIDAKFIFVGKKAYQYYTSAIRTETYDILAFHPMSTKPSDVEATEIADEIFEQYVGKAVDKVELIYSRFESLTQTDVTSHPLLPLAKEGMVRSAVDGTMLDSSEGNIFKLTSADGDFAVKREKAPIDTSDVDKSLEAVLVFDTDPNQLLDTLMPLYLNALVLRSLQESLASELACRMQAMSQASDNAKDLYKQVAKVYFRTRQSKITTELIEVVSGCEAAAASAD